MAQSPAIDIKNSAVNGSHVSPRTEQLRIEAEILKDAAGHTSREGQSLRIDTGAINKNAVIANGAVDKSKSKGIENQ